MIEGTSNKDVFIQMIDYLCPSKIEKKTTLHTTTTTTKANTKRTKYNYMVQFTLANVKIYSNK